MLYIPAYYAQIMFLFHLLFQLIAALTHYDNYLLTLPGLAN